MSKTLEAGLGNTVIKRSDLMNLYFKNNKVKEKSTLDFSGITDHKEYVEAVHKATDKFIDDFKRQYKIFAKSKLSVLKVKFKAIIVLSSNLRDHAKLLDDAKLVQRLDAIGKNLITIENKFKDGKYSKVSELKSALKAVFMKKIKGLVVDEDPMSYLDENKKGFKKLKPVSLKESKNAVYAMNAPLVFAGMLNNENVRRKLEQGLKLSSIAGYSNFSNAKFVIADLSKIPKSSNEEEFVNSFIEKVNKQVRDKVVPIHDISTEINGKYVVWVVPQMYGKYLATFLDAMEDSQILIK